MDDRPEDLIPGSGSAGQPKALGSSLRLCGYTCEHVTLTTGGSAALRTASSYCGCDMQPMYAPPQAV